MQAADAGARAGRRPVNLTISEDLLVRAKGLTKNLSATVELLLAKFVAEEEAKRRLADADLDQVISAVNAHFEEYGFLSDHFPSSQDDGAV